MKRFVMTLALVCSLSATALAGQIPSTDAPAPAPTPSGMTAEAPGDGHSVDVPGEMPIGGLSIMLAILDLAF